MKNERSRISDEKLKIILLTLVLLTMPYRLYAEPIAKIVAKVNNRPITSRDIEDYRVMLEYQFPRGIPDLPQDRRELNKHILNRLIEDQLTVDVAKKEREEEIKNEKDEKRKAMLEIQPEEIEERINEIAAGYPSRIELEKSLVEKGISTSILRERMKEQIMVKDAIDKHIRYNINVSPQKIIDYYNAHLKEMAAPLKYSFLLAKSDDRNLLDEIAAALKENGEEETYEKYKNTLTKMESSRQELKEEIGTVLANLKEKESAVETIGDSEYLLYLSKIIPERTITVEEARDKITGILWQTEYMEKLEAWLGKLKENAVIVILDEDYK